MTIKHVSTSGKYPSGLYGGNRGGGSNIIFDTKYMGTYNADTNTPFLRNYVGNRGEWYLTTVAGSNNPTGKRLEIHEIIIYNGEIWQSGGLIDNTDQMMVADSYVEIQGFKVKAGEVLTIALGKLQGQISDFADQLTSFIFTYNERKVEFTSPDQSMTFDMAWNKDKNAWIAQGKAYGGGGSKAQSNWTETDELSPQYIQNKPFHLVNSISLGSDSAYGDIKFDGAVNYNSETNTFNFYSETPSYKSNTLLIDNAERTINANFNKQQFDVNPDTKEIKIINSPTVDTSIQLYDLHPFNVIYDTNVIPSISAFVIKKPFPAEVMLISVSRILDSFYHPEDLLVFNTNLSGIDTKLTDTIDNVYVGADPIAFNRVYTAAIDCSKLSVDTEYFKCVIDVSRLLANPNLYNANQVLIKVEPKNKALPVGTIPALPTWEFYDKPDGQTTWHKDNKLAFGCLSTAGMAVYHYDSTLYNMYGKGIIRYDINMSLNQFTEANWVKYLVFKDIGTYKLDHKIFINVYTQGKVNNPYEVMEYKNYTLEVDVKKDNPLSYVVMSCYDNDITLSVQSVSPPSDEIPPYDDGKVKMFDLSNTQIVNSNPSLWGTVSNLKFKRSFPDASIYFCMTYKWYSDNMIQLCIMREKQDDTNGKPYGYNALFVFELDTQNRTKFTFDVENEWMSFTFKCNVADIIPAEGQVFASAVSYMHYKSMGYLPFDDATALMNVPNNQQANVMVPATSVLMTDNNTAYVNNESKADYQLNLGLSKFKAGDVKRLIFYNGTSYSKTNIYFKAWTNNSPIGLNYTINGEPSQLGYLEKFTLNKGSLLRLYIVAISNTELTISQTPPALFGLVGGATRVTLTYLAVVLWRWMTKRINNNGIRN